MCTPKNPKDLTKQLNHFSGILFYQNIVANDSNFTLIVFQSSCSYRTVKRRWQSNQDINTANFYNQDLTPAKLSTYKIKFRRSKIKPQILNSYADNLFIMNAIILHVFEWIHQNVTQQQHVTTVDLSQKFQATFIQSPVDESQKSRTFQKCKHIYEIGDVLTSLVRLQVNLVWFLLFI